MDAAAPATKKPELHPSWRAVLEGEFSKPYMIELKRFLQDEKAAGKTVFPPGNSIFSALNSTPFDQVKVVILGQDPYHGPGQAHGLCFSVMPGVPTPPSLKNIFKELHADLGIAVPQHGCLQSWAEQGVLLLNATLTVEAHKAGSHQKRGWEVFTNRIIELLNSEREGLMFLLWGSYAQQKAQLVDSTRHKILRAPHPSPLSAHRGFLGCRHFSQTNLWLQAQGKTPIDWRVC